MIKKVVKKIYRFRIFLFIFILFAALSCVGVKPLDISAFFGAKIGNAVGLSVGVEENPFNKLALQLKEKEDALNEREAKLNKIESELKETGISRQDKLIYGMGVGILVLFSLILINFILDHRERREENIVKENKEEERTEKKK